MTDIAARRLGVFFDGIDDRNFSSMKSDLSSSDERHITSRHALYSGINAATASDCGTLDVLYSGWIRTLNIVPVHGAYSLRGTRLET